MADFCKDCSIKIFGEDFGDLKGLSTEEDTIQGKYASVICEGCGFILVDHEGILVKKIHEPPVIKNVIQYMNEFEPTTKEQEILKESILAALAELERLYEKENKQ